MADFSQGVAGLIDVPRGSEAVGIFAPMASSYYKSDAVLYPIDGRSGTGSLLSKDKVVRGAGTEPLDYGSDSSEDLLYTESGALDADGFRESCPRIVSYLKADAIRKKINVKLIFMGIL